MSDTTSSSAPVRPGWRSAASSPAGASLRGKPRGVDASGRTVRFADGSELDVDAVIWATGYRPDYSWIELPVVDERGRARHRRGVTDVAGLYFLGLTWQHTRGSALLGWVKDDAEFIADQIAGVAAARAQAERWASETLGAFRPAAVTEGA
jgi:putative flavoprotein involved in K+ transport